MELQENLRGTKLTKAKIWFIQFVSDFGLCRYIVKTFQRHSAMPYLAQHRPQIDWVLNFWARLLHAVEQKSDYFSSCGIQRQSFRYITKPHDTSNTLGRVSESLIPVGTWLLATSSIWLSAARAGGLWVSLIATINKIKWLIMLLYNPTHTLQFFFGMSNEPVEAVDHRHVLGIFPWAHF